MSKPLVLTPYENELWEQGYQQGRADAHEEMRNNSLAYQGGYLEGRKNAIDEAIIEIQKLDYGVMDKDELFYKICDLLVKLKENNND